ncbi:MAG: hypothetical protein JNM17_31030 [Archangium sp.]|nr:hypothetical protein [Archangium sp.]
MLDTYIIEELKRREQERLRKERQRPTVEIPIQREEREDDDRRSDREERPGNAVVQIDL